MAPQFPTPDSLFNGSTDWPAAQILVKQLLSYVRSTHACCSSKGFKEMMHEVTPILLCMRYDSPIEGDNTERWHADIESSYRILFPYS